MEDHTNEIESKITFLERSLEQLNEVLIDHSNTIDLLKKEILSLKDKAERQGDGSDQPHDSPPPHY